MLIKKITQGEVIQVFDTVSKKYTSQVFAAGDEVDYEADDEKLTQSTLFNKTLGDDGRQPYLPFDMLQPQDMK